MSKEVIIPLGVLAIIASMLISMPPGLIDLLLVGNILLALLLFFGALYVSDTLKLSALPTILLLTTLYRLSLNVSTTRLILSGGEVGDVIQAFGNAVTAGNLVVGAVVFLVITLVQFIVVAKGAERVAEVSARFTLDALPGKQMSIDADVRTGLIDFQTARIKRESLQMESRFYGALDGAMKFVKGDAIAGLIITLINVIGGLCIGILLQGYSPQQALVRYTMLTVGDGLLSQVPALLYALGAGMVVTRVQSSAGTSLATDLLVQLAQDRKVRVLVGLVAIAMCGVPGMPILPFALCGIAMLGSTILSSQDVIPCDDVGAVKAFVPSTIHTIEVKVSGEYVAAYQEEEHRKMVLEFQRAAYDSYGFILEPPHRIEDGGDSNQVEVFLRGIRFATIEAGRSSEDLCADITESLLDLLAIHRVELVDDALSRRMLEHFEHSMPELISSVIPDVVTVTQLTNLLRELVHEAVDIKGFDRILQAIAETGGRIEDERELLVYVRKRMKRVISASLQAEGAAAMLTNISPEVDYAIAEAELNQSVPDEAILNLLKDSLSGDSTEATLVSSGRSRKLLLECLESMGIRARVVAHDEIEEGVSVQFARTLYLAEEVHETIAAVA